MTLDVGKWRGAWIGDIFNGCSTNLGCGLRERTRPLIGVLPCLAQMASLLDRYTWTTQRDGIMWQRTHRTTTQPHHDKITIYLKRNCKSNFTSTSKTVHKKIAFFSFYNKHVILPQSPICSSIHAQHLSSENCLHNLPLGSTVLSATHELVDGHDRSFN